MKYIIDAGSKSIKLYSVEKKEICQLDKVSYKLKDSCITKGAICSLGKNDCRMLIETIQRLKNNYDLNRCNTRIFATGHFRNFENISVFIEDFYCQTDMQFSVISQEMETFYQDIKFMPYSKQIGKTMVINIGGGSIQISFYDNGAESRNPIKLSWGTNYIEDIAYPDINVSSTKALLYKIIEDNDSQLGEDISEYPIAIFTGGELDFMRKVKYPLVSNTLVADMSHPCMINSESYYNYNETLFGEYSVKQLKALMPNNPEWMLGARPYSAIAQMICLHFGVRTIIPSDCNIIDGIVQQEFKNVVVCGSYRRHWSKIAEIVKGLKEKGVNVIVPSSSVIAEWDGDYALFEGDKKEKHCKYKNEMDLYRTIASDNCDAVIICNYDETGAYTASEFGVAAYQGKKIVFLEENKARIDFDFPSVVGLYIE